MIFIPDTSHPDANCPILTLNRNSNGVMHKILPIWIPTNWILNSGVHGNQTSCFFRSPVFLFFLQVQHLFSSGMKLGSSFRDVTAEGGVKLKLFNPRLSNSLLSLSFSVPPPPTQQLSSLQCHLSHCKHQKRNGVSSFFVTLCFLPTTRLLFSPASLFASCTHCTYNCSSREN